MAQYGILRELSGKEDWKSYTERLEQYFTANNVNQAAKHGQS